MKKQIDLLVRGSAFVPSPRPPNIIGQPWNNLTAIDIDEINQKGYDVKDVAGVICSQAGLYKEGVTKTFIDIEFKLLSLSVWAEEAHVSVYPIDYSTKGSRCELTRIDGSWAKNQWARAGYVYPASVQAHVLTSMSNTDAQLYTITTSKKTRVEVHLKVLWRSAASSVPSLRWVWRSSSKVLPTQGESEQSASSEEDQEVDIVMRSSRRKPKSRGSASSLEDLTLEVHRLKDVISRLAASQPRDEDNG